MDFSAQERARLVLRAGDLLVCEGGDIGRTAIWQGELSECYHQNHLHRLRPLFDQVEPRFYMYWMQAAVTLLGLYLGQGNKTTIPNLSRSRLSAFTVPLPPLEEQRAIASILSRIQRSIEATERVIAAARALKRSLMRHLFTYGPVPPAEAEQVPLKETEIGPVPEHWELALVDDVFTSRLGKMLSPVSRLGTSPRPYVRNVNVQWGRVQLEGLAYMHFDERELPKFRLRNGDVLVCEGGEVGRAAIWRDELPECYYQKAIHCLRPRNGRVAGEFFMYHMMNAFLIRGTYGTPGTSTTIAHLPGVKLKALKIPVPGVHEQEAIARLLIAADAKLLAEEHRLAVTHEFFRTMLHLLMTGQLRVSGYAPV